MNERAAVIYKSKYGSTKQYAEWVGESLGIPVFSLDDVDREQVKDYDVVILGGYIRIGKIQVADFLVRNWDLLQNKKIILFSVSAARPTDPEVEKFYEENVPADIRAQIRFFPLWGRVSSIDLTDTLLLTVPRTANYIKFLLTPKAENRSDYGKSLEKFDHVERTALEPLLQYYRGLLNPS